MLNIVPGSHRYREELMVPPIYIVRELYLKLPFCFQLHGDCEVFSRFTNYSPLNSDIDSRFPRKAKLGPYFKVLGILKLENLVWLKIATFISQIRNKGNNIPHLFSELLLSVSNIHSHSTRYATQDNYYRIHARTNYGKFSFKFFASKFWQSITMSLKLLPPNSFRAHYKLDF